MDKSFNDQELSDIMKEIEALEEEFSDDSEKVMEASSVIEDLADLEEDIAIPTTNRNETVLPFQPKAKQVSEKKSGAQSAMAFKVSGDLNLDLSFDIGGKTIELSVTETGLTIHMDNGVTFSVPVSDAQTVKKAV